MKYAVPRLIHQLWKTDQVPPMFRHWADSWQRLNPGYAYRLWTNADIERLVEQDFPEWLETFWSYSQNICRVDLARCLILKKHGGIYADLDFECLRPQEALLQGRSLVLGTEPDSHARLPKAARAGLERIVCNAWMASAPEHPFWEHLLAHMKQSARAPDVLDATGPFALTRALASYCGHDVTVLPPEVLYPVAKEPCWSGRINELDFFEQATREAFAIHYWEGSWHRRGSDPRDLSLPAITAQRAGRAPEAAAPAPARTGGKPPLISCLMVTRGQPDMLRQAIRSFQSQTYPNLQLVLLTDAPQAPLSLLRAEIQDARISWVFVQSTGKPTLGQLRNLAIEHANGEYVAQWDDDDLYDPSRLQLQMDALLRSGARACMLQRWLVWWPLRQRLFLSPRRAWEGSLLCLKAVMPRYPLAARGEDTAAVRELLEAQPVVLIDVPRLYTYVVHGTNTWNSAHFENIYRKASLDFTGSAYQRMLHEVGRRVDIAGYPGAPAPLPPTLPGMASPPQPPRVLILTPMKNTAAHLETYFRLLQALDHPRERLSLCILEGDSEDGTHERLQDYRRRLGGAFARFEVFQHHAGLKLQGPRWRREVQLRRRTVLAEVRNRLLSQGLGDEDWVLWLDADLADYPPSLLKDLLAAGHDIVVPHCVRPDGKVFDKNTFCFHPDRKAAERPQFLHDGIFQPPSGQGRTYLDQHQDQEQVPVDSVGGTALLVRADLHRRGLVFPAYSHRGYIETEGLAAMARDMGVRCWGLPRLRIVHCND